MLVENLNRLTSNNSYIMKQAKLGDVVRRTGNFFARTRGNASQAGSKIPNRVLDKSTQISNNLEKAVYKPAFSVNTNPGSNALYLNLANNNAPAFSASFGSNPIRVTTAAQREALSKAIKDLERNIAANQAAAARGAANLEKQVANPAFSFNTNAGSNSVLMNLSGKTPPYFNVEFAGSPMNLTSTANSAANLEKAVANTIGNQAANTSRGLAWKVGLGSALGGGLLGTIGNRIFAPDPTIQYIQPSTQYYRQPEFIY